MSLVDKVMVVDAKGRKKAVNRKTAESERMQRLHKFQIIDEPIPAPVDKEPVKLPPSKEEVVKALESWKVPKLKEFAENIEGYEEGLKKAELIDLIADQEELYVAIKND